MGIKAKLSGFMPDISGIQNSLNSKFDELIGELRTMHGVLNDMLVELRKQNQGAAQ